MATPILALCNQKGGVGKSTTAFQLARAAIRRGQRVLLVDADPQGNLTSSAAAEYVPEDAPGLADALSSHTQESLADVVVPGVWPGLDLVPTSGAMLGSVRDELIIAGAGRESRLRDALAASVGDYDLILIDCAPSLDQLTINALTAATAVVVVTHAKQWSLNGLAQLLNTIDAVRAHYNPNLRIGGVVINQLEDRTTSANTWRTELEEAAEASGFAVLHPPIPKRVAIADATEASTGLDEWPGADDLAGIYDTHLAHLTGVEQ